jgi:hypothetical protein
MRFSKDKTCHFLLFVSPGYPKLMNQGSSPKTHQKITTFPLKSILYQSGYTLRLRPTGRTKVLNLKSIFSRSHIKAFGKGRILGSRKLWHRQVDPGHRNRSGQGQVPSNIPCA